MRILGRAQLDLIFEAAREGGLQTTAATDWVVVEQVVWHKYCQCIEQRDGSFVLVATEAGKIALAAAKQADAWEPATDRPTDAAHPSPVTRPADPKGKLGELVALLRRPGGATVAELAAATGWRTRSVRGAMSGPLKKRHGLTIVSQKSEEDGRLYGIPPNDAG